ncbi:Flagelliform silk protein [Actinomycetales bacterium JB111]|nr:Flagelliform silk protein [Actinomycetales bacterium JB111]
MQAAAGWHQDPWDPASTRYWDGQLWTDRQAPAAATSADYPGSQSPVPTGEHQVGGTWVMTESFDDLSDTVDSTTGTYAYQAPDGGYNNYSAAGEGQYRSGGVDPYEGQAADPAAAMWQQHSVSGATYGDRMPGVGGRLQDPAVDPSDPSRPGGLYVPPRRSKGPVIAIAAVLGVAVLGLGAWGIASVAGGDDSASPTQPPTLPPSTPPTTPPPSTQPPTSPPGTQGSAGGDGDTSGLAYYQDLGGFDLGSTLTGAFPAQGEYAVTLHVEQDTTVLVAAFSPEGHDLEIEISGNGVDETMSDSLETYSFIGFSSYPSYEDPSGFVQLDAGDYDLVLTEAAGQASAFELTVLSGEGGELADGDVEQLSIETGAADLYSVELEDGESLTVSLSGDGSDPYLYIVSPDGTVEYNDDWGSADYDGPSLDSGLDSGLTVSDGAGTYIVVATTYAGSGGDMTMSVTIDD